MHARRWILEEDISSEVQAPVVEVHGADGESDPGDLRLGLILGQPEQVRHIDIDRGYRRVLRTGRAGLAVRGHRGGTSARGHSEAVAGEAGGTEVVNLPQQAVLALERDLVAEPAARA